MKKKLVLPTACLVLAIGGCASTGQMRKVEATGEENQRVLRETDQRLHNLENSVAALNSQVALLNNRVYEVRTRSGHKTGMTVVPIIPPQTARHTIPASSPQSAAMPHGDATGGKTPPVVQGGPAVASAKKIDPAAPPAPFPGGTPSEKSPWVPPVRWDGPKPSPDLPVSWRPSLLRAAWPFPPPRLPPLRRRNRFRPPLAATRERPRLLLLPAARHPCLYPPYRLPSWPSRRNTPACRPWMRLRLPLSPPRLR